MFIKKKYTANIFRHNKAITLLNYRCLRGSDGVEETAKIIDLIVRI